MDKANEARQADPVQRVVGRRGKGVKRYRMPEAKPGELLVKFGKEYGNLDLYYCYPNNECGMKADTRVVMTAFERLPVFDGKTMRQELEARGYDITTLKFSVMKKTPNAD